MTAFIFIIILILLVLSHEFGHFIAAKKAGMRVDEFGFGFPPKIFGKKFGETLYTLNLIPLGGFVKIHGEDGDEEPGVVTDKERLFSNRPKILQAIVLIAGVAFNVLLAWVLFVGGFMYGFPMQIDESNIDDARDIRVIISEIFPESPAEIAGLGLGDTVLSLRKGDDVLNVNDVDDISTFISSSVNEEIVISVQRGADIEKVSVIPEVGVLEDRPGIGVALDIVGVVSLPAHEAIWQGTRSTFIMTGAVVTGFYGFIFDAITGGAELDSISGPVGIYNLVDSANGLGISYVIGLTAIISISLAVINLLPFPALDGGRLLFLIIEVIKGSPINQKVVNILNWGGFAILIILMILVSYNDLLNLGIFS